MDKKVWSKPVTFERAPGRFVTISNTEEASRYLLGSWAGASGVKHLHAQRVCYAVLEGRGTPEHAREAFVASLMAAEIFIKPSAS